MEQFRPATDKQIAFAERIAQDLGADFPDELREDGHGLTAWIDEFKQKLPHDEEGQLIFKPTMKQTQYAENIQNSTGIVIPSECYKDARAMGAYIDANRSAVKNKPTPKMVELVNKIRNFNPEAPEPGKALDSFEETKQYIDTNFPEEWRRGGENRSKPKGGRKRGGMEDML